MQDARLPRIVNFDLLLSKPVSRLAFATERRQATQPLPAMIILYHIASASRTVSLDIGYLSRKRNSSCADISPNFIVLFDFAGGMSSTRRARDGQRLHQLYFKRHALP